MSLRLAKPVALEEAPNSESGVHRWPKPEVTPAWPELVALVRAQVRSLVGPTRDLEDLTQATLEQVVRSLDRFEGRSELSTFTYRIALHVVMNHWRSLKRYFRRFVLGVEDVPEPEHPGEGDTTKIIERQRAARLHHHLDRLSADHRVVVVLADLEGRSHSRVHAPDSPAKARTESPAPDLGRPRSAGAPADAAEHDRLVARSAHGA
jgi:RNA polymerase sigma factor (sigma-70 family)